MRHSSKAGFAGEEETLSARQDLSLCLYSGFRRIPQYFLMIPVWAVSRIPDEPRAFPPESALFSTEAFSSFDSFACGVASGGRSYRPGVGGEFSVKEMSLSGQT